MASWWAVFSGALCSVEECHIGELGHAYTRAHGRVMLAVGFLVCTPAVCMVLWVTYVHFSECLRGAYRTHQQNHPGISKTNHTHALTDTPMHALTHPCTHAQGMPLGRIKGLGGKMGAALEALIAAAGPQGASHDGAAGSADGSGSSSGGATAGQAQALSLGALERQFGDKAR